MIYWLFGWCSACGQSFTILNSVYKRVPGRLSPLRLRRTNWSLISNFKIQYRPEIPIHEPEGSSSTCQYNPSSSAVLLSWAVKPGWPVVGGRRCVDRGEGLRVFAQSKAPFSSHEAFMNRHLPPLLSIPLTDSLPLSSSSFFFFILQTLCPSFPRPLHLSHS